jgi:hypothetical protein
MECVHLSVNEHVCSMIGTTKVCGLLDSFPAPHAKIRNVQSLERKALRSNHDYSNKYGFSTNAFYTSLQ